MSRLLFGSRDLGHWPADLGIFIARAIGGASLAIAHGWSKLYPDGPPEQLVAGIEQRVGLPEPQLLAWAVGLVETVGGALLAIGLLTRPAALAVAINMGVATFVFHAPDPFAERELALLFFTIALTVFLTGPGRISVDRLLLGSPAPAGPPPRAKR